MDPAITRASSYMAINLAHAIHLVTSTCDSFEECDYLTMSTDMPEPDQQVFVNVMAARQQRSKVLCSIGILAAYQSQFNTKNRRAEV